MREDVRTGCANRFATPRFELRKKYGIFGIGVQQKVFAEVNLVPKSYEGDIQNVGEN